MVGKPVWRYYREIKISVNETLQQKKGNGNGKKIKQKRSYQRKNQVQK